MAATVTDLETRRGGASSGTKPKAAKVTGPTVRASIDAFLDTPKVKTNPNTLRAYTNVLDRAAEQIGSDRRLAASRTRRSATR